MRNERHCNGKPPFLFTVYYKKGGKSIAESKAHKEWTKKNTTFIGLKLNNNTDKDILQALEGKPKQTEIKKLIRKGLEKDK